MTDLELLVDLHKDSLRQGPGSDAATRLAMRLAGLSASPALKVADIGCGTGASALLLAKDLNASVTAVDIFPEFLSRLEARAESAGVKDKVTTLCCPMDDLPFGEAEFDVIWSEGAAYIMGFEEAVAYWKRFLKPVGVLAISEITWLTATRPVEIQDYWEQAYPQIGTASAKIAALEKNGFTLAGYFSLPALCWMENYYQPLLTKHDAFLERNGHNEEAKTLIASELEEIEMYKKYGDCYSYGFYIARKV